MPSRAAEVCASVCYLRNESHPSSCLKYFLPGTAKNEEYISTIFHVRGSYVEQSFGEPNSI